MFVSTICDNGKYYYPTYVNRFTKLGTLLRMWFQPLQQIYGNIVEYEDITEN